MKNYPSIYSFDQISAAEFGFEMFSYSSELHSHYILFHLLILDGIHF